MGLGLAHMKAWELVARRTTPHLILEDDTTPTDKWIDAIERLVNTFPDFDLLLLNALRPHGVHVGHGVLRVDTTVEAHSTGDRMSNAWLSSYMLSPKGAAYLLERMKRAQYDLNRIQFDHALMRALGRSNINVYVVSTTNRYFVHDETDSDKVRMNDESHEKEMPLPMVLIGLLLLLVVFACASTITNV